MNTQLKYLLCVFTIEFSVKTVLTSSGFMTAGRKGIGDIKDPAGRLGNKGWEEVGGLSGAAGLSGLEGIIVADGTSVTAGETRAGGTTGSDNGGEGAIVVVGIVGAAVPGDAGGELNISVLTAVDVQSTRVG